MEERLQKLLSACGLASRRTVEQWIEAGRVTVNGTKARLGTRRTWTGTASRWMAGRSGPAETGCI